MSNISKVICFLDFAYALVGIILQKAVALVNDNRSVRKEFIAATRALKLSFKTVREREFEITLYTLWQLHKKKKDREMSFILEYILLIGEKVINYFYCLRHCGGIDFISVILFQYFTNAH